MLKIYKYCFYRITRFWDHPVHYSLSYDPLTQKVDPTHLISSMGIVSLLFGRGWCGYACWTAMILDLLPYKKPAGPRRRIGFIRYIMFALSLGTVILLIALGKANKTTMFYLFVAGNVLYYVVGIVLALVLKDNRAFCKYICPITVFLKPMSYYSLLRVRCDESKCIKCGTCLEVCPMDVEVNSDARNRKNATECILCQKCKKVCPVKALR